MTVDETYLVQRFDELVVAIEGFVAWFDAHAGSAEVYALPLLDEPVAPTSVPVKTVRGGEALGYARSAYQQFEPLRGQAPGTAFRLPGVVWMTTDDLSRAHEINRLKAAFSEAVREYESSPVARTRLCRRLFGRCYMGQLYRSIPVIEPECRRIVLGWSPRTVSTRTLSAKAAIKLMSQDDLIDDQANRIARERLAKAGPNCRVTQRLPVAPHPRLTIHRTLGRGGQKMAHHANVPALVSASLGDCPVRPLPEFDATVSVRSPRLDRRLDEPLLRQMNLYLRG